MKTPMKFLTCLLTAASLWSCSDAVSDDATLLSEPESLITDSRTVDEILKIASDAYSMVAPDSRDAVNLSHSSIVPVRSSMYTTRAGDEPLIYAVNYGEGRGFALVSSSKKVTPLIGVSENGDYDPLTAQDNENFQFFLDAANDYAEYKASAQSISISDTGKYVLKPYDTYVRDTITQAFPSSPKIKVNWGQMWPENIYCNNGIAGCGPIALAQALSYFKTPTTLTLSFDGRPQSEISINWNEINKHKQSEQWTDNDPFMVSWHAEKCEATTDAHNKLALIVRQIGHLCGAYYYDGGTTVAAKQLLEVTKKLLHRALVKEVDPTSLFTWMRQYKYPIAILNGSRKDGFGHSWVADATYRITITDRYRQITGTGKLDYKVIWEKTLRDDKYIHFNWGWHGDKNGYFLSEVFDPQADTILPPEHGGIIQLSNDPNRTNTDLSGNMFIFAIQN